MQPLCHDEERSILLQFKETMIINKFASLEPFAYPKVASWKADKDCCSWDGVKCNEVTGHLVELNLTSSCLYGSIDSSSSLFHLVHLTRLSLADNDFNGSKIPSAIKNLSRLSYLNLHNSSFSGQIPSEVLELSKLETLDIMYNFNLKLHKPSLRSLLEKLTQLKVLYLAYVDISSPIPDILVNYSSLTELSLKGCHLQGEFPAKTFQLPNLRLLSVGLNPDLFGSLPEFQNNNRLEVLRLFNTPFFGEIPHSIGNLNSLRILDISSCSFSGLIPPSLGNLSSLEELVLLNNDFSSHDFHSLSWMARYSKLTFLSLSATNLVGEIPPWLMSLTTLTMLHLSKNGLNGTIPSQIRNLTQLKELALDSNKLQGPFPSGLYYLQNLDLLYLDSNNLSGTVDLGMISSKLINLENFNLSSNNFSLLTNTNGDTKFPKLRRLGLGYCNLNKFPSFLKNQHQLADLDLNSNKIAGKVPRWFLNISVDSLQNLNLANNLLTGFD